MVGETAICSFLHPKLVKGTKEVNTLMKKYIYLRNRYSITEEHAFFKGHSIEIPSTTMVILP